VCALEREVQERVPDIYEWILSRSVSMPAKAYRWGAALNEIAKRSKTGNDPRMLLGAAGHVRMIAATRRQGIAPSRRAARPGCKEIVGSLSDDRNSRLRERRPRPGLLELGETHRLLITQRYHAARPSCERERLPSAAPVGTIMRPPRFEMRDEGEAPVRSSGPMILS